MFFFIQCWLCQIFVIKISNGHSPANLSNLSTRRKFASLANASTRQNALFWKMGRTRYIRPTFANYFPRTRYIRPTFANPFPRTRYIRSRSHSPTFAKMWLAFDTFARVIRHFGKFGASGHCLYSPQKVWPSVLLTYPNFHLSSNAQPVSLSISCLYLNCLCPFLLKLWHSKFFFSRKENFRRLKNKNVQI